MHLIKVQAAAVTAMFLLGSATDVHAAEPMGSTFTYQGQLKEQGAPLDGSVDLTVSLFDVELLGDPLGLVELANVAVSNGLFTVDLDFGTSVFNGDARWIEIAARSPHDPSNSAPYTTLTPRQRLTPSPFAMHTRGLIVDNSSHVGIGTHLPEWPLHVEGEIAVCALAESTLSGGYGVFGISSAPNGAGRGGSFRSGGDQGSGVYGWASSGTGDTFGVYGRSFSDTGCGVRGEATSLTGTNYGVIAETKSPDGYGGYFLGGRNYFEGDVGIGTEEPIWPLQVETTTSTAIYARTSNNGGIGVRGVATTPLSGIGGVFESEGYWGVQGVSNGTSGRGVYGFAAAFSGTNYGIYGRTSSQDGYAGYFRGGRNYFEGDVGIGTDAPSSETSLHIQARDNNFGLLVDSAGTTGSEIGLHAGASGYSSLAKNAFYDVGWSRFDETKGAFLQEIEPDGDVRFKTASSGVGAVSWTTSLSLTSSGFVGIGASSPVEKLHISGPDADILLRDGGGNPFLEIGDSSVQRGYLQWQSTDNDLLLYTSGHDYAVRIGPWGPGGIFVDTDTNSGRVGIGTTSPQGTLDVNGAIYQRGTSLHADYVFEAEYALESIEEHSDLMWTEGHLPAVPRATKDAQGRDILEVGSHRRGILEELEKAHIYIEWLNAEQNCLVGELKEKDKRLAIVEARLAADAERIARLEELVMRLGRDGQGGGR